MAAGDLTTLANVREVFKLKVVDTGDDAYLSNLITRVSAFVKNYTGRKILDPAADVTEIHDGRGRSRLRLRDWPVITMTSVHEDPEGIFGASALIPAADYLVDKRLGQIVRLFAVPFLRYPQSIKIIYRPGYAATPADIEQAAIELVVAKYLRRKNEGVSGRSLGDGSVQFFPSADISKDIRRVLDGHRSMRMP